MAIIWVIHNYGKFKILLPSLNRERYRILWYCQQLWFIRNTWGSYSIRSLSFASASNWITAECVPDKPQQLAVQLICTTVASYCARAWWPFELGSVCSYLALVFATVMLLVCRLLLFLATRDQEFEYEHSGDHFAEFAG